LQSLQDFVAPYDAIGAFISDWQEVCDKHPDLVKSEADIENYRQIGVNALKVAPQFFLENLKFKNVIVCEQRLEEAFKEQYPQIFKGFIDIVFEMEDGKYIIADIKTCSSAFMFRKYQDAIKEYQLTLYKHFYAKKFNIDPDKIETYFILVEKDVKSKKPIQFSCITSGAKKVQNALEWVEKSLVQINRGMFLKNRMHCNAYGRVCPFYDSVHCTK